MNQTPQLDLSLAHETLAANGKSFRMASLFLPSSVSNDAAVVYRFCRAVDDAVDETSSATKATAAVKEIRRGLRGAITPNAAVHDYLQVARRLNIPSQASESLLAGVRSDIGSVRIRSVKELGCYAYRVAGVVGQMMMGVLRVRSPRAIQFAVDLGMAMQLTNICRDVMEDACRNRVYLPADLLIKHGVTAHDVVCRTITKGQIVAIVSELLDAAEVLYNRAKCGMHYIPLRSRVGIYVALRLYRGIGRKLRSVHGADPFHGRTILSLQEKIVLSFGAIGDVWRSVWSSETVEEPPASPFGCGWEELAEPCRLDAELRDTDFGAIRRRYDVAS